MFVRTPTADEAVPGMDEHSDGIPGLLSVSEIVELFDASGSSGDANRGRP